MPSTSFVEYARSVHELLDALVAAGDVVAVTLHVEAQANLRGFIEGNVRFADGSLLAIREFVNLMLQEPRLMYAYHYQDRSGQLVFGYDNARHRPPLSQAEHKHTQAGIEVVGAPTLADVLREIVARPS